MQKNKTPIKKFKLILIPIFIILLDQTTKLIALKNISPTDQYQIFSMLNLILVFNPGAAFSFMADGYFWQKITLIFVPTVSILFFSYLIFYSRFEKHFKISLAVIIGGASGNLIDRILYGHVIDFIDFHINNHHWPTFNIADTAITIGAIIIIYYEFKTFFRKND